MSLESDLGPLWEIQPKVKGFRLSIPDPVGLQRWAVNQAIEDGNVPPGIDLDKAEKDLELFSLGMSKKLMQREKVWRLEINDDLFTNIEVSMDATYSPISGEYFSINASLGYSEKACDQNLHLKLPRLGAIIARKLGDKVHSNPNIYNPEGLVAVVVPDLKLSSDIRIILGYKTLEAAAKEDSEEDPEEIARTDIIIVVDEEKGPSLKPTLVKTLNSLQQFQYVVPHAIDVFYEVLGLTPPNLTLSLSPEYEVK